MAEFIVDRWGEVVKEENVEDLLERPWISQEGLFRFSDKFESSMPSLPMVAEHLKVDRLIKVPI